MLYHSEDNIPLKNSAFRIPTGYIPILEKKEINLEVIGHIPVC